MSRSARLLPAATAGLALLASLLVISPPGEASRTVSEAYTVPASGNLALTGHGYGHGHGMSQYGAQGAALKGLTYQQIVAFYYPGTTLGSATGSIRVLITADNDNDVRVVPASGLAVRQAGSATSYVLPTNLDATTWRLAVSGSSTVVQYYKAAWHNWKKLTGDVEFFRSSGALTLRVAGTTRTYRGALRLSSNNTVNVLPLDSYVRGVVPREMPASWQAAAVRAQAVAARTYAAFDRAAHTTRYYDTCDTTSCQVYGGFGSEDSRANDAVVATAGKVLTYGGKPAFTQFGSSSGGWLSAGSQPYLVAKADSYDNFSGNPMHTWTKTLTKASIQKAYPSLGTLKRVIVSQRDGHGDWYGRVEKLTLDGSKNNVALTGDAFRSKFGLRSSWFHFGSGTTTPPPSPEQDTNSPIYKRWQAIGGNSSVVGRPTGAEYSAGGGRAQRFTKGRIFYKAGPGAHELYGRILTVYSRHGSVVGKLGFPKTKPQRVGKRLLARFEHGAISVARSGKMRAKIAYTS